MAVVASCAFDQWQKDVFFSAAEEVQESADTMESVYRMWIRDRAEGSKSEMSDVLCRELQASLGTAKWQLEEFERAVSASYGSCSTNDGRIARHGQFIFAIQSQIARVEKSLGESLMEEGKQPLQWVQLDDEERDALAMFLSTNPKTMQEPVDKPIIADTCCTQPAKPELTNGFKETVALSDDSRYAADLERNEMLKTNGKDFDKVTRIDGQSRTWSSPDIGAWKIVIADEEDAEKKTFETRALLPSHVSKFCSLMKNVGKTEKLKWQKNSFRKEKRREHLHLNNGVSSYLDLKRVPRFCQEKDFSNERQLGFNENPEVSFVQQVCGRVGGLKRHYNTQFSIFSPSLRITLLLILILFLFVPFVFFSN